MGNYDTERGNPGQGRPADGTRGNGGDGIRARKPGVGRDGADGLYDADIENGGGNIPRAREARYGGPAEDTRNIGNGGPQRYNRSAGNGRPAGTGNARNTGNGRPEGNNRNTASGRPEGNNRNTASGRPAGKPHNTGSGRPAPNARNAGNGRPAPNARNTGKGSPSRNGKNTGRGGNGRNRGRRRNQMDYFPIVLIMALTAVLIATVYGACSACRSCSDKDVPEDVNAVSVSDGTEAETQDLLPEPDPAEIKAESLLVSMTDAEKVGSLLLVRGDRLTRSEYEQLISDIHAGGAVLFKSDFEGKDREGVTAYTSALQEAGGGHLFICVDEEGGDVVRVSSNKQLRDSRFRSPRRLYNDGGFENIASDTLEKCELLKGLGINVNFAPVADVVTDEDGFLYKRAFGGDAESTAEYVETVVGIMKEQGMGSSVKHFPGYGNAHGDTHEGLVESAVTEDSLRTSDLVPFMRGIEAGADSVMITHTIISCIDPERPCSLSPAAVSLLREELGFDGVIITDGLDMGAVRKFCGASDPCVRAFLAGCDLMCTPENPRASYSELLEAVNSGEITRERLDESVKRILMWKIRLGLYPDGEEADG